MPPDIHVNVNASSGDQTGGDKLTAGDIAGEGIAVGRQAQAHTGGMAGYMGDIWAEALRLIRDLERRLTQLEIRLEMQRERDAHDRQTYSPGWIIFIGGVIALSLISLLLFLALSGYK